MAIPDFQTLMLPVLQAASKSEVKMLDLIGNLADAFALSEEDRTALVPSGKQTTLANRANWAKTYLSKAGLIETTRRGRFTISDEGRQVLANPPDRISIKYLERFPSFREFQSRSRVSGEETTREDVESAANDSSILAPDEAMRLAQRQLENTLGAELLDRLSAAPPEFFERAVVKLLSAMGYGGSVAEAVRALGKSGDGGVDGVIDQDALGLDRVYVQAKRYAINNPVGAGAIRDFFGSLDRFKAT